MQIDGTGSPAQPQVKQPEPMLQKKDRMEKADLSPYSS